MIDTPIHTNEQSIDRVLGTGLPVLLVFWRKGCSPCEQVEPALHRVASGFAGRALVARVDVQDNPALVRRYGVTHLPELVLVRGQHELGRARGAAAPDALRGWVERVIAGETGAVPPAGPSVPLNASTHNGAYHNQRTAGHTAQQRPTQTQQQPRPRSQAGVSEPVILTDATFDQVVGSAAQPVLVDFWAPWCGPCRAVAPAVEQLAREFAGRATVAKLNVDENPRTAQRFGITGIPALLVFKRGQVVEQLLGAQPASVLRQALAKHTG